MECAKVLLRCKASIHVCTSTPLAMPTFVARSPPQSTWNCSQQHLHVSAFPSSNHHRSNRPSPTHSLLRSFLSDSTGCGTVEPLGLRWCSRGWELVLVSSNPTCRTSKAREAVRCCCVETIACKRGGSVPDVGRTRGRRWKDPTNEGAERRRSLPGGQPCRGRLNHRRLATHPRASQTQRRTIDEGNGGKNRRKTRRWTRERVLLPSGTWLGGVSPTQLSFGQNAWHRILRKGEVARELNALWRKTCVRDRLVLTWYG